MSRKQKGAPFTLFAFQDAMTSVCGVVVLITLLLALQLTRAAVEDVREIENAKKAQELNAEIGDEVELPVICVVDGSAIEADPEKASATKVTAEILDQYKGKKQLVFKFKKRKGYKKLRGHRQQMTRLRIVSVGDEKWTKPARKAEEAEAASEE